jgi:hypothetical protein
MLHKLNIPPSFTKQDIAYMLADAAAGAVQYGMKWKMCDSILPLNASDPLGQYNAMITEMWGPNFTSGCYYSTACLSNASMSSQWAGAGYAWIYQTCAEMAYFQVGYHGSVRLPDVSTEYFMNQCRSAFGQTILPDVYTFNVKYGGLHPDATNVIALQGSDDPWSTTGIRSSLGPLYPAVVAQCEDCGHCGDLMVPLATDPPSLVQQRNSIVHYVDIWISSESEEFVLVLAGNFSFILSDPIANAAIRDAVERDLRNAIDQSVEVSSIALGSLIVQFTLQRNTLNEGQLRSNIRASTNNSAWLVDTQYAYNHLGGTGVVSVVSLTPVQAASEPPRCSAGCVAGIVMGVICVIVALIAIFTKLRQHRDYEQVSERETLSAVQL